MTQTDPHLRCLDFQHKLLTALEAAWTILDGSDDPAEIRRVRDKVKAIGELAAMVRKVALAVPAAGRKLLAATVDTGLAATQGVANLSAMAAATAPAAPATPVAAQAEHARRALEKLKGGRRGRP